jgi:hypothetical protein
MARLFDSAQGRLWGTRQLAGCSLVYGRFDDFDVRTEALVGREVFLEQVSLRRRPAETENHVGSLPLRGRCLTSEVSHDHFASLQFLSIICHLSATGGDLVRKADG